MSSDLIRSIERAQVHAGEVAVMRSLDSNGLLSAEGKAALDCVDDTQRCISARNALNAAVHGKVDGEWVAIESLDDIVATVCIRLKRLAELEAAIAAPAAAVQVVETEKTLICSRCKLDRFKVDCPQRDGCPMVGTAQLF